MAAFILQWQISVIFERKSIAREDKNIYYLAFTLPRVQP